MTEWNSLTVLSCECNKCVKLFKIITLILVIIILTLYNMLIYMVLKPYEKMLFTIENPFVNQWNIYL